MRLFIYCCFCICLVVAQLVPISCSSCGVSGGGGDKNSNNNNHNVAAVSDSSHITISKARTHSTDQYCTLHLPDSRYLPHFIERYQDSYRYISMHNGTIHIRRGQLLLATCYGNLFKLYPAKMLEIHCPEAAESPHTETVVMHHGVKINHNTIRPQEALLCKKPVIGTYMSHVDCCFQQSVSSGFFSTTNQTSFDNFVRLADYCYNPQGQNLQFVKYLLVTRDVRVDEQLKYNFNSHGYGGYVNVTRIDTHSNTFDHLLSQSKFFEKIRESFGGVAYGDEFVKTSLIPKQFFFSQFQDTSLEPLASAVQWSALSHGNWRVALNDLTALAQQKLAMVYAGTSGKLFLSDYTGKLRQVNIKSELFSNHVVTIPFYFWLVVNTGGQNQEIGPLGVDETKFNESIAIIFINNPYLKVSNLPIFPNNYFLI